MIVPQDYPIGMAIEEILPQDAGFVSRECGFWTLIARNLSSSDAETKAAVILWMAVVKTLFPDLEDFETLATTARQITVSFDQNTRIVVERRLGYAKRVLFEE